MQTEKAAPGPAGTSCLTCKQRHKKCDTRRPICARCEKGGYDCLGYSHNKRGVARLPRLTQDITTTRPTISSTHHPAHPQLSSRGSVSNRALSAREYEGINLPAPSPPGYPLTSPEIYTDHQSARTIQQCDNVDLPPDLELSTTQNWQPLLAVTHPPANRSFNTVRSLQSLFALYNQIPHTPYHLSKTFLGSSNLEDYVMSHCDRMTELAYFKPVEAQLAQLRNSIVARLRASELTRWAMFICTRIRESHAKGDATHDKAYNLWIRQMEQAIKAALDGTFDSSEFQERLGDWLEVLLLNTVVLHSSNTYQVLRNATPTFLQMVFSDPTLWPSGCDLTTIPLINVIASPRHEFAYFTLMDTTTAMAFGLPQQVEYNTSLNSHLNGSIPHDWVYSTPVEFHIALAEINACRDKSPNARDWKEIEHTLTSWQPRSSEHDADWESWMVVAWLAVQESWRHALLVYLYLAVCGLSSDDLRIRSSVRQILRVLGTVRKRESPDVNVPFFIQYLMAGICARSEKHRSIAREHLANVSDTKFWLMRAVDFVPVLDDLWHGAAAGGRPIKWEDYLCSRKKIIPVVL